MIINTNERDKTIRPIKQGGTGAATAAAALKALGGLNKKLLWENASPSSVFTTQTITIDLSDVDSILLITRATNSASNTINRIIDVGDIGIINGLLEVNSSENVAFMRRTFEVGVNGVLVNNSFMKKGVTGSTESSGKYIVPFRIYGIKGVQ